MFRIVSTCALFALVAGVITQSPEGDVRGFYGRFSALSAKGDVKTATRLLESHLAPDFISQMGTRKDPRKKFIADVRSGMLSPNRTTLTAKVLSLKKSGNSLVVPVAWNARGKDSSGKTYSFNQKTEDVWTKTSKGYRLKTSVFKGE